jgi:uncharacterized protein YcbK (DUF882 family)
MAEAIRDKSRRRFVIGLGASALLMTPGARLLAAAPARDLRFLHTHTGERASVTYFEAGRYLEDGLAELNHLLRDFRTGDATRIDPALFDVLHGVQQLSGSTGTFEIISGYRSPATNEALRKAGRGVARKSQHTLGKAIDVRLTDLDTAKLRDAGIALGRGGVGYYASSDFVHLDTGRARRW